MKLNEFLSTLKTAFWRWRDIRLDLLAGGLAYFALFSATPFFVILLGVLGRVVAMSKLMAQLDVLLGPRLADLVRDWLLPPPGSGLTGLTLVGLLLILYGASLIFVQLKSSLDYIWGTTVKIPKGWKGFLKLTLAPAGMIAGAGVFILAFVFVDAGFGVAGRFFGGIVPGLGSVGVWKLLSFFSSLTLFTLFFAGIFKWMPDAYNAWSDVWPGAILTSVLFALGKMALGLYFTWRSWGSLYGAAGSLIAIMVWVYFSAHIFFFGAVFTFVYRGQRGKNNRT